MSRILADKVTNYNNDGPFDAEKGINIPLNRPLQVAGSPGVSGQYLASTGIGLVWKNFPDAFSGDYADLTNKPALFSGDYGDLVNPPFVPPFVITTPSVNDYLRYNGSEWINTPFPTIYQYELQVVDQSPSVEINLNNLTTASTVNTFQITGGTGIDVTLEENIVTITGQSFTEYTGADAVRDVGLALQNGEHTDIIFNYSILNGTISASVAVTHTLSGSSNSEVDNDVTISVKDSAENDLGSVTLVGSDGIGIAWDSNSSTATFSYTDPSPYTLPTASISELGGVKVDGTTITIDGNGIITANFIDTGIELTDLSVSVSTEAGTATGGISYNSDTGEFTYTNVATALGDITDLTIDENAVAGDIITYIGDGNGWTTTSVGNALNNASITDLLDVVDTPTDGHTLVLQNEFFTTLPSVAYTYIDFTLSGSSITISNGDPITDNVANPFNGGQYTPIETEMILRSNHPFAEINASLYVEGAGNTVQDIQLQRRVDIFGGGNYTEGTWTAVKNFRTSSDVLNNGPTTFYYIDNHGQLERPDKLLYRMVADGGNLTVYFGYNNIISVKLLG